VALDGVWQSNRDNHKARGTPASSRSSSVCGTVAENELEAVRKTCTGYTTCKYSEDGLKAARESCTGYNMCEQSENELEAARERLALQREELALLRLTIQQMTEEGGRSCGRGRGGGGGAYASFPLSSSSLSSSLNGGTRTDSSQLDRDCHISAVQPIAGSSANAFLGGRALDDRRLALDSAPPPSCPSKLIFNSPGAGDPTVPSPARRVRTSIERGGGGEDSASFVSLDDRRQLSAPKPISSTGAGASVGARAVAFDSEARDAVATRRIYTGTQTQTQVDS
jgi:hypothetical protein